MLLLPPVVAVVPLPLDVTGFVLPVVCCGIGVVVPGASMLPVGGCATPGPFGKTVPTVAPPPTYPPPTVAAVPAGNRPFKSRHVASAAPLMPRQSWVELGAVPDLTIAPLMAAALSSRQLVRGAPSRPAQSYLSRLGDTYWRTV